MIERWVLAAVVGGGVVAAPGLPWAQQQPVREVQVQPRTKTQDRMQVSQPQLDVEELTPGQIQRAQEPDAPPVTPGQPRRAGLPQTKEPPSHQNGGEPAGRTIACNGPFGPDSNHMKLAAIYRAQNIAFTDVEGPDGSKVMASVLFPRDTKRRLEVWWQDTSARSGTYLIVIGGKSTWVAPKGVKLGLQLAALERLNGRAFKLQGFTNPNGSQVTDWSGGALAQLPGGCKVGVRLVPDPQAPAAARTAAAGRELQSSDTNLRALKPAIAEIILGY
jgi:hypothetical protein